VSEVPPPWAEQVYFVGRTAKVRQAQKPIPRRFLAILPAVLIFGSLHQGKEQKGQQATFFLSFRPTPKLYFKRPWGKWR
jgi:hypothetical protein